MTKILIKNIYISVIILTVFLLAYLSAVQMLLLPYVPNTPNQDLARHVALALNFRDAILSGQLIPRLQLAAVHGVQDIPVFQYYGFLSSLLAQIGLFFKLPELTSLILGVVIARWIGCLALLEVCRKLNLGWHSGLIAVLAWLFFPYIQTNLYGRAAIPEAVAQALLPLIPLVWVIAIAGSSRAAAILTSLTVLLLALAHPIFLMWGVVTIFIFIVLGFFMERYCAIKSIFLGLIAGICLSSFQWLPALITKKDFFIPFLDLNPSLNAHLTSYSGFYGLPEALVISGNNLFLTVSMWLMPAILTPIFFIRRFRNSLIYLAPFMFFLFIYLFLAYSRLDFWVYLPKVFWGTQFPYRMLSFVAVFGVIILAYAFSLVKIPKFNRLFIFLSYIFLIFLSGKSLLYVPLDGFYVDKSSDIKSDFGSLDYVVSNGSIYLYGDKWLIKDNFITVPNSGSDQNLYVVAKSGLPENLSINLKIIDFKTKTILRTVNINSSSSNFKIEIPYYVNKIAIIPDDFFVPSKISVSSDSRELSAYISYLEFAPLKSAIINPVDLNRSVIGPYSRKYVINREMVEGLANNTNLKIILPIAYSRLWFATQNNRKVDLFPNQDGYAVLVSQDISPIILTYKMPFSATILSVLGFLMLCFIVFIKNNFFRVKR